MAEQNNNSSRQGGNRRNQQPVDNTYAHVQPQALEVERAVLGGLLSFVRPRNLSGPAYLARQGNTPHHTRPTLWARRPRA